MAEFERMAEEAATTLPDVFLRAMENVRIVVEDLPERERPVRGKRQPGLLLGLYQGVPLTHRGTGYGMYPVVPDTITLYRENILAVALRGQDVPGIIRDTLIHEIGHHFGMNEDEIRAAGY